MALKSMGYGYKAQTLFIEARSVFQKLGSDKFLELIERELAGLKDAKW